MTKLINPLIPGTMDGGGGGSQPQYGKSDAETFSLIFNTSVAVLDWFCTGAEVFLRYDFGERYLSPIRLYLAYSIMLLFPLVPMIAGARTRLYWFIFVAFIGLGIYHRFRIWQRERQGIAWHSRSFGVSWLSKVLPVDDWTLYRYVEPGICLLLGAIVWRYVNGVVGAWLTINGFVLLIKNYILYFQHRERILDMIDARIEASYMQNIMAGAPKQQTAGYSMVRMAMPKDLPALPAATSDMAATVATTLRGAPVLAPVAAPTNGDFADTLRTTLGE